MIILAIPVFLAITLLSASVLELQLLLAKLETEKQVWFNNAAAAYEETITNSPTIAGTYEISQPPLLLNLFVPPEEAKLTNKLIVVRVKRL